jgi:hypothetical protein
VCKYIYEEWKGSKWSKDMKHLELQAPQPSLDIALSLMKAMQGIFAGALVELADLKAVAARLRRLCIHNLQKRWNRRHEYYGKRICAIISDIPTINEFGVNFWMYAFCKDDAAWKGA